MFYLHTSNRTENLLRHLSELLRVQGRDLFAPEYFLVQGQGMERIISQRTADAFGAWCNFRYLHPLDLFADIAVRFGLATESQAFSRRLLVWRIEALLRDAGDPALSPLAPYLAGENAELKRFQLAWHLAYIFDQYQVMRPELLAAWERGRAILRHPAETWQMALWQRLVRTAGDGCHRGAMLQRLIDRLEADAPVPQLPSRLSIFGLHTMPPLFLKALRALARRTDVHLHLLSPCSGYWGDLPGRRQWAKRMVSAAAAGSAEPEGPEGHPLLVALGRQGRDFQAMLLDQVDFEMQFASFEDPLADGEATVLRRLQSDMLHNRPWPAAPAAIPADDSLLVVSCHSRLREVAVLREHVLDWLHRDPGLELRDIVVMAPDIQEYATLVPAVFADIQHTIADRSLRRRNRAVAAFLAFLELLDGRFGWSAILDLLEQDMVASRFGLAAADLDRIRHWVAAAGIRWGLSAEQRQRLGLPAFGQGSWRAGLERLLMGYAMGCDEMIDGILPYPDIEGGPARALGSLCEFLALVGEAERELGKAQKLSRWSELLASYARHLLAGDDSDEFIELQRLLAEIEGGSDHDGEVVLEVIRAWLENASAGSPSASGFLRGQLTFCSMLPMRSIPFRVVCLLGLNDGAFPGVDRHATFDLMGVGQQLGDRSRRDDDRYQFLEALLAARDRVYLSYVGRSVRTNEPLPPSVVVAELLEILDRCYGLRQDGLVSGHPLHPFSRRYFTGREPRLFSYDAEACAAARQFAAASHRQQPWWSGETNFVADTVSPAEFLGFFRNPQRWFVRTVLGLELDLAAELPDEDEPFTVTGLDAYAVDRELVESQLADGGQALLAQLQEQGRWPLGTAGRLLYEKKSEEIAGLIRNIAGIGMGERLPDLSIDLTVAGLRLQGSLGNLHENGVLLYRNGPCSGRDLLALWLHGLLAAEALGKEVAVAGVFRDQILRGGIGSGILPDLSGFAALFADGCRRPSPLLVEPAWAYVRYLDKGESTAMARACASLEDILEKGYRPELALLLRGRAGEEVLDGEFAVTATAFLLPLWRALR